jgi:hypothetical protein
MFRKMIELVIVFSLIMASFTLVASADQTNDSDKYTFKITAVRFTHHNQWSLVQILMPI